MAKAIDITGKRFNELIAVRVAKRRKLKNGYYDKYWLCECSCGNKKIIKQQSITSGHTKSCGHLVGEYSRNQPTGANSPSWKGGRRVDGGYVFIYNPLHPNAKSNGYVREHVLVMEQKVGRHLLQQENVHHIDGNKINNNPDNLELWSTSQPSGQRVADKLEWARKMIELYE